MAKKLKIKVGETYIDGAGGIVKIIGKLKNQFTPYIGVSDYSKINKEDID